MPQIGGYTNANPWPGWKCCDPRRRKFWLGGNDNYAMVWDAREIYWQDTAISRTDSQPGAWACVHDCKRFEAGGWPRGEPKQ